MAVKQKVVECVAQTAEAQLQVILRELQDITTLGPQDQQLCIKIVISLGNIDVPNDPSRYKQFVADVEKVQDSLVKGSMKHELVYVTLFTFFQEILCSDKILSPAMSIVLQLIDKKAIPNAVKRIFQSYGQDCLKRALTTLCTWLTKWTYTENLGILILNFMQELESQHNYDVLYDVINATIETFFKLLIQPIHRKCVGPIVLYMLTLAENNLDAFSKVIPHVNNVVNCLNRESSESSLFYLQKIVFMCVRLMEQFPQYNNSYGALKSNLEPYILQQYPPNENVSLVGSSPILPICSTGRVGLNNLGNTCYMNSVLQALYMTKQFRNEVLLNNKKKTPLSAKLQELFALLQFSQRPSLAPNDISVLARKPGFTPGHQHDSSEFLGHLLDVLHEQENAPSDSTDKPPGDLLM